MEEISEDMIATPADFAELIQANQSVELLLVNIVQKRLLAEKSAEIQRLRQELKADGPE